MRFVLLSLLALLLRNAAAQSPAATVDILSTFDYPLLHSLGTWCNGISNNGDVVGSFSFYTGTFGFELQADGEFREPISSPGRGSAGAQGINTSGIVCGVFSDLAGTHGFFFNGKQFLTYDYPGASYTIVNGENDLGDFVGVYNLSPNTMGFANVGGVPFTITLPDSVLTVPSAINNHGEIVGYYYSSQAEIVYGFFRDAAGNLTDKIVLHHSIFSRCLGINDKREIAGDWADHMIDNYCHGVIFRLPDHSVTFDIPGSYNTAATGINNSGEICGYYWDSVGTGIHGFTAQLNESN